MKKIKYNKQLFCIALSYIIYSQAMDIETKIRFSDLRQLPITRETITLVNRAKYPIGLILGPIGRLDDRLQLHDSLKHVSPMPKDLLSAIVVAILYNRTDLVELLIKASRQNSIQNILNLTPENIEYHVKYKNEIRDYNCRWTPLCFAIMKRNPQIIELLLENGATCENANATDFVQQFHAIAAFIIWARCRSALTQSNRIEQKIKTKATQHLDNRAPESAPLLSEYSS